MKTAMQQHIEWLKATLDICKENAPTLVNCINLCISDSESRLGIEKEQIMKAFYKGRQEEQYKNLFNNHVRKSEEQYYKETYEKNN